MVQKNKRQGKNKGFSLVELIVVMAIMAILVGAIAPQVIRYVERARESRDMQVESTLLNAFVTAIASEDTTIGDFSVSDIADNADADFVAVRNDIQEISGFATNAAITNALRSNAGRGTFTFTYTASTGRISVQLGTLDAITN